MALTPKMTKGVPTRRYPLRSISQYQKASRESAMPVVKITYELVHRFLLIGKYRSHTTPSTRPTPAITKSPKTFSYALLDERSQCPVRTPKSAVDTAGTVLRIPSGSHVFSIR